MGTRLLFATYVLMGVLGVLMLADHGRADVTMYGVLLVLIAAGGLVLVSYPRSFHRRRPAPELGRAPSGVAALFFRRSAFMVVLAVVSCLALAGWLGVAAVLLHRRGYETGALVLFAAALVLLWPVVTAGTGRIRAGGLWLAPSGIEYRHEALSWSVPWDAVVGVEAGEPVLLRMAPESLPVRHRTVWWIWNREVPTPEGTLGISAAYLAGGASTIAAVLGHHLADPRARERLGTADALQAIGVAVSTRPPRSLRPGPDGSGRGLD